MHSPLLLNIVTISSSSPAVHPSSFASSSSSSSHPARPDGTDKQSSRQLPGGGSILAPRAHEFHLAAADFEEYELSDYTGIQERKEKEVQLSKREIKRQEKRRQLDQADEMKFSHSIQFNAVPDWSSHYIAYSNLKKLYVSPLLEI